MDRAAKTMDRTTKIMDRTAKTVDRITKIMDRTAKTTDNSTYIRKKAPIGAKINPTQWYSSIF
ncbi:hypothetical protein [Lysinibacillus sp. CTST325]